MNSFYPLRKNSFIFSALFSFQSTTSQSTQLYTAYAVFLVSLLLLLRKKSRSACLLVCKRTCYGSLSLPTLYESFFDAFASLVGLGGLEPPTSRLSGVRSSLLSYKPISLQVCALTYLFLHPLVEMRRIELLTPCLQGRCSPS